MNNQILLFLFFSSWITITAQETSTLKVLMLDGQEKSQALSVIGRLEFSADSLFLVANDGSILCGELKDNIQRIEFCTDDMPHALMSTNSEQHIHIFPNPVQQIVHIKGIKANETIRIFSLSGNLIISTCASNINTDLDVSDLPNGQYLLQINTQVLKLIKQ